MNSKTIVKLILIERSICTDRHTHTHTRTHTHTHTHTHPHTHTHTPIHTHTHTHREWVDAQPGLVSSVVYSYLSLIPSHFSPSLTNLREQEAEMCVSFIRTRVLTRVCFCCVCGCGCVGVCVCVCVCVCVHGCKIVPLSVRLRYRIVGNFCEV